MKNYFWSAFEKISIQFVQVLVIVLNAKILGPEEFAEIAFILLTINMVNVICDSGFSIAIIREQGNIEVENINGIFLFNMLLLSFLVLIYLSFSGFIFKFFDVSNIIEYEIQIIVIMFFSVLGIIPKAKLSSEQKFKELAIFATISTLVSAVISVTLVFLGYGIKAIVYQQICYFLLFSIFLYIKCSWSPSLNIKFSYVKLNLKYSFSLTLSNIINLLSQNILIFILPKFWGTRELGLYYQSKNLTERPASVMNAVFQRVNFTEIAIIKNNSQALEKEFYKKLQLISFFFIPVMFVIAIISKEIIAILFDESWSSITYIVPILAVSYSLLPISSLCINMLQSKGMSKEILFIECIKKSMLFLIVFLFSNFNFIYLVYGLLLNSFFSLLVNLITLSFFFKYCFLKQVATFSKYFFFSALSYYATSLLFNLIVIDSGLYSLVIMKFMLFSFLYLSFSFNTAKKYCFYFNNKVS